MKKELIHTMEMVSLKLVENENHLIIKSKLDVFNKSNFGVIVISMLSLVSAIVCYLNRSEWVLVLFGVMCCIIFVISLCILIEQSTNYLKVTTSKIKFKNSFKSNTLPLDSINNVKMNVENTYTKITGQPGSGSFWYIVELFLEDQNGTKRILDYQIEMEHFSEAKLLGTEIVENINQRIKACNNR